MTDATIIVTGLGRCGTSLIMQMLAVGGLPMVGIYPDFESEAAEHERGAAPSLWLSRTAGRAVKVLDPHLVPPPAGGAYRAIWLTRDLDQQAASQIKLIGAAPSRSMRRGTAQSLRRDEPRARHAVEAVAAAAVATD
ncbi:hypothetical protein [Sphingomonas rubra]|uniref:Sulfotransferase family protein n=1 Tax=Sphingomonas rubra TaxID=634430 RepID=A0A1I5RVF1_9SPHN|nr:hypothetical protein [Sphingomonas rubra]SFP62484.1 hypothetical protein SAMN04488241_104156 [Sphingomonas rubra]